MSRHKPASLSRDLSYLFTTGTMGNLSDGQLLAQFISDDDDRSFGQLIARHGPMVLAICRRSLDDPRDIEDAFQAVFLILLRKARSLRDRNALSSWLHGVSLRVARRTRRNALRRQWREQQFAAEPADRADMPHDCGSDEVRAIVDQEIRRLPRNQQIAVVLCLLEGHTHRAAATNLGWPLGTLKSRIATARQTLSRRLSRRGLSSPVMVDALRPSLASFIQRMTGIMLVMRIPAAMFLLVTITVVAWTAPTLLSARPAYRPTTSPPPQTRTPATDGYGDPLPTGAALRLGTVQFRHDRFINNLAYSPDGQFLITDDWRRNFQVWDSKTGKKIRQIDSGLERTRYFCVSPDGQTIAAIGDGQPVHRLTLTSIATGRQIRQAEWEDRGTTRRVFFAPDGKTLATASGSGYAAFQLWDAATAKILYREDPKEPNRISVAFCPDARSHILAIASPNMIRLWDTENRRDLRTIAIDSEYHAGDIEFSPDGSTIVANVRPHKENIHEFWLFRVKDGAPLRRITLASDPYMYAMKFSHDGKVLAAIGDRDQLLTFDVVSGKELKLLPDARATSLPLVFSPDCRTLATIAGDQVLHFWDWSTGKDRLASADSHSDNVEFLDFINDGTTLVSKGRDNTIRFWDLATGRCRNVLSHTGSIRVARRPHASTLAVGLVAPGPQAKVWDLETGVAINTWSLNDADGNSPLKNIAFNHEQSAVIALLDGGSLRSWDIATGDELKIAQPQLPRAHGTEEPSDSVFSHDGQVLALIGNEGSILIVHVPSGRVRFKSEAIIQDPKNPRRYSPSTKLEFAPDDRTFAFVRQDYKQTRLANGEGGMAWPKESTLVWVDSQTGLMRREIVVPESNMRTLAFSPDGQLIAATTSSDQDRGNIRIFRLSNKKEVQTIDTQGAFVTSLAFTPDGAKIAAGLSDTSIVLWSVRPTD